MATLNYHHLRYFWTVAHEGHLSRAAKRLAISQSAVSTQIKQLEEQLGHALFERRGRQLILTEAGRITLEHADAIFSLGDELLGTLGQGRERSRAILRIGALATLSRNFQADFLRPLVGRDDVELVLRSGLLAELLAELEAHRIDVLLANVTPVREPGAAWVPHLLAEQRVSLIGRPEQIDARRELVDILAHEPLLLPSAQTSIRMRFDAFVDRLGVRPRIAGEVDDMAMLRLLAREGAGLAVAPPIVVKDELADGELVELRRLPKLRESFYAITMSRRFPNALVRELITARPGKDLIRAARA